MQEDFHYYATYCAAYLAGYTHGESQDIAYSAQFVDCCSKTLLKKLHAPVSAATTQLQLEMMDMRTDLIGLQDITRIWASFHFLPYDLFAETKGKTRMYRNKYRLICNPNSNLLVDTIGLAKDKSLQAVGVAMHVLADTWAHRYFAGTPSFVINNTEYHFYEVLPEGDRHISFRHNPVAPDDVEKGIYTNSVKQESEEAIMVLGHGRAGHLPDYSFITYRYLPAWNGYREVVKDNPKEYYQAFCQMVYAMKCLKEEKRFLKNKYAYEEVEPYKEQIDTIIRKRQRLASDDWKAFGESLSGQTIEDFDINRYQQEYIDADKDAKNETFLGRFILAALSQKSMVTNKIFKSGSLLAGFSVDFAEKGFKGIKDYLALVTEEQMQKFKKEEKK